MADSDVIEKPKIVLNLKSTKKLYSFFPLYKTTLEFSIKTDKDIYVCLTPSYSFIDPRYYEINIGGYNNTKSTVSKDVKDNILATHRGTIIEKGKFNKFWIKINKELGVIEVGKGETTTEPFLRATDPDFVEMAYFGMSTDGSVAAEWIMDPDILVQWP